MMGGAKAHYDGSKAFSKTDQTEDLKAITVPTLVLHGEDDQIVPGRGLGVSRVQGDSPNASIRIRMAPIVFAEDRTLAGNQPTTRPDDGSRTRRGSDGVVLRLSEERRRQDLRALMARGIKYHEVADMVRWVRVQTPEGMKHALTFWASTRRSGRTRSLPMQTAAELIANACEQGGSCAQYLHNTIVDLEAEGIRDRNLRHLQALMAERIKAKQAA